MLVPTNPYHSLIEARLWWVSALFRVVITCAAFICRERQVCRLNGIQLHIEKIFQLSCHLWVFGMTAMHAKHWQLGAPTFSFLSINRMQCSSISTERGRSGCLNSKTTKPLVAGALSLSIHPQILFISSEENWYNAWKWLMILERPQGYCNINSYHLFMELPEGRGQHMMAMQQGSVCV